MVCYNVHFIRLKKRAIKNKRFMDKLQAVDLDVLCQLLFPEISDWLVYAPNYGETAEAATYYCGTKEDLLRKAKNLSQFVLFNFSDENLIEANAEAIVSLGKRTGTYQLAVLCNPDGSIRWLYPKNDQSAYFLHLYSPSAWRGKLLKQVLKWGHRMYLGAWLRDGILSIGNNVLVRRIDT